MFVKKPTDYITSENQSFKDILVDVCQSISYRVSTAVNYKTNSLFFLDLTTYTETGSFKDLVGSHVVAYCLDNNIHEFITQSSGNTANSIAYYATKYKVKVTIVYPRISRYKIIADNFSPECVTFVEIDKPEAEIKHYTQALSEMLGLPKLPEMPQQIEPNNLRANFLFDFTKTTGIKFQYTSQAISSGSGIFGLYRGLKQFENSGFENPAFIGVQQKAVSPYRAFIYGENDMDDRLIEPTLYRKEPPADLLHEMKAIVSDSNGMINAISYETYQKYQDQAISLINQKDIEITKTDGIIIEKAGVLSTVGVLDAIDRDLIAKNSNILVTITGGTAKGKRNCFVPHHVISRHDSIAKIRGIFELIA